MAYTRIIPHEGTEEEKRYGINYFIKFSTDGDTLTTRQVYFKHFLTDYVELPDSYYAVITDIRTMGGPTVNYLNKYTRNWELLWSKKIRSPKFPTGNSLLSLTRSNQLLLISDESGSDLKLANQVISIKKFDLEGNRLSNRWYYTGQFNNPVSILKTHDDHFLLTAHTGTDITLNLWILKLNHNGDTISSKRYNGFYPRQTIQLKDSSFLFYGSGFYETRDGYCSFLKILKTDKDGRLLWQRSVRENVNEEPGSVIETGKGSYLFSGIIEHEKNKQSQGYLFELDNNGRKTFERKLDYPTGIFENPPQLISGKKGVIVYLQQAAESDEPFHNVIVINKIAE